MADASRLSDKALHKALSVAAESIAMAHRTRQELTVDQLRNIRDILERTGEEVMCRTLEKIPGCDREAALSEEINRVVDLDTAVKTLVDDLDLQLWPSLTTWRDKPTDTVPTDRPTDPGQNWNPAPIDRVQVPGKKE